MQEAIACYVSYNLGIGGIWNCVNSLGYTLLQTNHQLRTTLSSESCGGALLSQASGP
jgi:hypothetical protein